MSGAIGVGVGDFIAVGRIVIKTVQTFRESKSSITRFQRLEHRIATFERSLITCRESNSGVELSQQGRDVRNGVADMSLALGSCEEAIVRFRRDMEAYKGLLQGGQASSRGVRRVKEMFATAGKKMTFTGDLETALARFEEDLRMNLMCYEMNSRRISRLISARKHRQHAVHLDGVSKKLAEVSIDVGKLKHMMEALLSEQQKMGRAIKRCSDANGNLCLAITTGSDHDAEFPKEDREFARALNSLASEGMKALRRNSDCVMLPLLALLVILVRYLRLCLKVLPRELGYVWDTEAGYRMGISILDPIGRTLPVPQQLCSNIQSLHDVIEVYFREHQGHGKVVRGEYCLARSTKYEGCKRILTEADLLLARRPGSKLSMYMKVQNRKFVKHSDDLLQSGEGVRLCPQCGTLNYPSKNDRNLISCIGCSSEVRIFLDDVVKQEEDWDDLPPSISEAALHAALEDFNEHATECPVCRDPMRAYFQRKPLCPVGHNLSQPIRDEFEQRQRHIIHLGSSTNTPISFPNAEGPAEDLICVLNTMSGSGLSPGGVFSAGNWGPSEESENTRYLRVFTVAPAAPSQQALKLGEDVSRSSLLGTTADSNNPKYSDSEAQTKEQVHLPQLDMDSSCEKLSPRLQGVSTPEKASSIYNTSEKDYHSIGLHEESQSTTVDSKILASFLKNLSLLFQASTTTRTPKDPPPLTSLSTTDHLSLPRPQRQPLAQPTTISPISIPKPPSRKQKVHPGTGSPTNSNRSGYWRSKSRQQTPRSISSTASSASLLSINSGTRCYSPANTIASTFHTPRDTDDSFLPCRLAGFDLQDQQIQESELQTEPNHWHPIDPFRLVFDKMTSASRGTYSSQGRSESGCNASYVGFPGSGTLLGHSSEGDRLHGSGPRQIYERAGIKRRTGLKWDEDGGMFVYKKEGSIPWREY